MRIDRPFFSGFSSVRVSFSCEQYDAIRGLSNSGSQENLNGKIVKSIPIPLPPTKAQQQAIAEALSDADAFVESLEQLIAKKRDLKQGAMQELLSGKQRLHGFVERWPVTSLAQLFTFQNGVNADRTAYGRGIPFINVLEVITHSTLTEERLPGRISLPHEVTDPFRVQTGDLLFNRTSETQEELGLASVYMDNKEVVFGGFVIRARPRNRTFDPVFSSYSLRSPLVRRQIVSMGQGAVRANIGQVELSKVQVSVPPLREQAAIAAVLSDMDAEIAAMKAKLTKTRQLKQGMMLNLLTGRIRLVGSGSI
jgi:type I restriction enzyme S subunit